MTGGTLQLGYDSSFTTITTKQCWTRGCLLQQKIARCVSIYKYIKNLSVKTGNWLIEATATGLEVKGMYTSQKYSSLLLIDWDSTLCFQSGQDQAAKLKKKKQTGQWKCHTQPHSECLHRIMSAVLSDLWGFLFLNFFFSSLFLQDVVSGLLSARARMELCDTAWPLTYCDELWVYLLRLAPGWSQDGVKTKRTRNVRTGTDVSTDGQTEKQADRQRRTDRYTEGVCGWRTVRAEQGCKRKGVQGLTGQIKEQE